MDFIDDTGGTGATYADLEEGMPVYSADGQQIGEVATIYRNEPGLVPAGSSAEAGPVTDQLAEDRAAGYIKVRHGGILGIGGSDLYIPFGEIDTINRHDNVTVRCTKDGCTEQYGSKPDFLADGDAPPLT